MTFWVRDNLDDLRRDFAAAEQALFDGARNGVARAVEEGAAEARANHKFKNGPDATLEKSIRGVVEVSTQNGAAGVIEATAKHASYLRDGTPAHEIRPKEGQGFEGPLQSGQSRRKKGDIGTHRSALRWEEGGSVHFARVVHHPGTAADPFMDLAEARAEKVLLEEAEKAVERAASILKG